MDKIIIFLLEAARTASQPWLKLLLYVVVAIISVVLFGDKLADFVQKIPVLSRAIEKIAASVLWLKRILSFLLVFFGGGILISFAEPVLESYSLASPAFRATLLETWIGKMSTSYEREDCDNAIRWGAKVLDNFGPDARPEQRPFVSAGRQAVLDQIDNTAGKAILERNLTRQERDDIFLNAPRNEVAYAMFILGRCSEQRAKTSGRDEYKRMAQGLFACCSKYDDALVYDKTSDEPFFWHPATKCRNRIKAAAECKYDNLMVEVSGME